MGELYTAWMKDHLQTIEQALPAYLPQEDSLRDPVIQAMTYACAAGGKRIRPVLTMEFCRLTCGEAARALPFAAAVEMIHSYSLIHDDLPCMDNSPLRRGKPAVHVAFGENMAVLAGDALLNRAFEIVLRPSACGSVTTKQTLAAASALADAAGIAGMVGGQTIDLRYEGQPVDLSLLETLQRGKTAALLIASCVMGAIVGGGTSELIEAALKYVEIIGLCFEILDDILDVTSTPEQRGKPTGSDAQNQKTTYVSLLGIEEATKLAQQRTAAAIEALSPYGTDKEGLCSLAEALLHRDH